MSANVDSEPKSSLEVSPTSIEKILTSDAAAKPSLKDRTNDHGPQKVDSKQPTPAASKSALSIAPARVNNPSSNITPQSKSPFKHPGRTQQASDALPPISDPGYLLTPKPKPGMARFARVGMVGSWDRALDTPELPKGWTDQHDRAICYLDVRGYELKTMIKKLRNYFPELYGQLTEPMVDKRLRQLDQNLDVTYWADAMRDIETTSSATRALLTPTTSTPASRNPTIAGPRMADAADLRQRSAVIPPQAKVIVEQANTRSTAGSPTAVGRDQILYLDHVAESETQKSRGR